MGYVVKLAKRLLISVFFLTLHWLLKVQAISWQDIESPANDFHETPPGLLPLHTMVYFARKHQEQYVKVRLSSPDICC